MTTKRRRNTASKNKRNVRLRNDSQYATVEELILSHTIERNIKLQLDQITESFNIREVRTQGSHWDSLVQRLKSCIDPSKVILVIQIEGTMIKHNNNNNNN